MSLYRTLILGRSYQPHEIVDWKVAVTRLFKGKLEVLAQYDEVLTVLGKNHLATFPVLRKALRQVVGADVQSLTLCVPAVAVLRRGIPYHEARIKLSKRNLCARDGFCCQYCGAKKPMSRLTYDHIVPKRQGGRTTWDNIVMACAPCNGRKGGRTPSEAGMRLLTVPRRPKLLPVSGPHMPESLPEEWVPFLSSV